MGETKGSNEIGPVSVHLYDKTRSEKQRVPSPILNKPRDFKNHEIESSSVLLQRLRTTEKTVLTLKTELDQLTAKYNAEKRRTEKLISHSSREGSRFGRLQEQLRRKIRLLKGEVKVFKIENEDLADELIAYKLLDAEHAAEIDRLEYFLEKAHQNNNNLVKALNAQNSLSAESTSEDEAQCFNANGKSPWRELIERNHFLTARIVDLENELAGQGNRKTQDENFGLVPKRPSQVNNSDSGNKAPRKRIRNSLVIQKEKLVKSKMKDANDIKKKRSVRFSLLKNMERHGGEGLLSFRQVQSIISNIYTKFIKNEGKNTVKMSEVKFTNIALSPINGGKYCNASSETNPLEAGIVLYVSLRQVGDKYAYVSLCAHKEPDAEKFYRLEIYQIDTEEYYEIDVSHSFENEVRKSDFESLISCLGQDEEGNITLKEESISPKTDSSASIKTNTSTSSSSSMLRKMKKKELAHTHSLGNLPGVESFKGKPRPGKSGLSKISQPNVEKTQKTDGPDTKVAETINTSDPSAHQHSNLSNSKAMNNQVEVKRENKHNFLDPHTQRELQNLKGDKKNVTNLSSVPQEKPLLNDAELPVNPLLNNTSEVSDSMFARRKNKGRRRSSILNPNINAELMKLAEEEKKQKEKQSVPEKPDLNEKFLAKITRQDTFGDLKEPKIKNRRKSLAMQAIHNRAKYTPPLPDQQHHLKASQEDNKTETHYAAKSQHLSGKMRSISSGNEPMVKPVLHATGGTKKTPPPPFAKEYTRHDTFTGHKVAGVLKIDKVQDFDKIKAVMEHRPMHD